MHPGQFRYRLVSQSTYPGILRTLRPIPCALPVLEPSREEPGAVFQKPQVILNCRRPAALWPLPQESFQNLRSPLAQVLINRLPKRCPLFLRGHCCVGHQRFAESSKTKNVLIVPIRAQELLMSRSLDRSERGFLRLFPQCALGARSGNQG
jgi:hypothetical protein